MPVAASFSLLVPIDGAALLSVFHIHWSNCLFNFSVWISSWYFKLQICKIDCLIFPQTFPFSVFHIRLNGNSILPVAQIKIPGVIFTSAFLKQSLLALPSNDITSDHFLHFYQYNPSSNPPSFLWMSLVTLKLVFLLPFFASLPSVHHTAIEWFLLKPKPDKVSPLLKTLHCYPCHWAKQQLKLLCWTTGPTWSGPLLLIRLSQVWFSSLTGCLAVLWTQCTPTSGLLHYCSFCLNCALQL